MEDSKLDLSYKDDDLHTILIKMIKTGRIRAKIDMAKNIVVFEDEALTIQQLVKRLEEQSSQIIEILKEVENTDKNLILQKKAGIAEMEDENSYEMSEAIMDGYM
jgi:phage terminase small subunit